MQPRSDSIANTISALAKSAEEWSPAAPKLLRVKILGDDELEDLEDPEPLVEGVLMRDTLTSIFGAPATLKTFIALDIALCVASGCNWHGRKTHRGPVVYICAEGARGMKARVSAWKQANDIGGRIGVSFIPESVIVTERLNVESLLAQLKESEIAPVLIVIDTLSRNFRGKQNDDADMGAFVQGCDRLRTQAGGATILAVHHEGHAAIGRSRGSSALPAALDTEISVTRDGNQVTLKCTKQKDAIEFTQFTLESMPIGESLVLCTNSKNDVGVLTANERRVLHALQDGFGNEGASAKDWKTVSKLAESSFFNARTRLVQQSYVKHSGSRYKVTESGLLLLNSNSNGTPSHSNGRAGTQLQRSTHPLGGGVVGVTLESEREIPPGGEEEQSVLEAIQRRDSLPRRGAA
ncbi:MAG: AAA family ATPase [Gemmatimonadaceae bacterium]